MSDLSIQTLAVSGLRLSLYGPRIASAQKSQRHPRRVTCIEQVFVYSLESSISYGR
jgi:hypothetical protein